MNMDLFSPVEKYFIQKQGIEKQNSRIPYVLVDNFPQLGLITALRFLEWVHQNPDGVISLPTGKTPEYFIRWTQYLLKNWNNKKTQKILEDYHLEFSSKPKLSGLQFVQIDEFYPINPRQKNSFYNYVKEYYIKGFGLDPKKAMLINAEKIPLANNKSYEEIFPDLKVDLSLRYREAKTQQERCQKESIFLIDEWCARYEENIRKKGGIGFFLGGIGPDGHIAFNIKGSDHYSTTRLMETNFETQAVAAGDLGGIDVSKNRLVITIGLHTITYNPDAVAIIFAAGEAKADVVKNALEKPPSNQYPASVLQKQKYARFYLTKGAAVKLEDSIKAYYSGEWNQEKTERAVLDLLKKINKYGNRVTLDDLKNDPYCSRIPDLDDKTVLRVIGNIKSKLAKGMQPEEDQRYYHTGPHHDDIMLGFLPHIAHQLRQATNTFDFSIMTSGFTAVTNKFIIRALEDILMFLDQDEIQMIHYPDFYQTGYKHKWDKDVYHYLGKVASGEPIERRRGLSHRLVRAIVDIYSVKNTDELRERIKKIIHVLQHSYDGEKNPPDIQKLKGMLREFEEELVWAHFGVRVENVHHLRLGFYTGDIFTEQPERSRDVMPILEQLRAIKPTVISLALDPEGSGPDTHYKVLQAIAEAVRMWKKEEDLSHLRIIGYRNVWYRFHPAEINMIVPVSLNSLAILDEAFTDCYLSQVEAPFPSYMLDGKFSTLTQKIWIEQMKHIQLLLGKDFFYENPSPRIRAAHGLIFLKEMDVDTFLNQARELEKSMEGF
ncbi:6-phosphogluconolactonase [Candidatus Sulfidibacterium hydrothermale]|nr:6-phosphogluconolactonase [Candidatus Sulfidibacterium hydrothermale]UBM61816.1 6-phosphogluconolactonase [Candidatus Sulfidibacterium hydrothermale]